ncbi:hypothetical protein SAICODRAFT_143601 [Saitoella complicata NRRL Y-17804]|uniref:uncharacterized protein n=1 Tax=Saitoella complicata (strain BCRC 22490 / CBS 7301 / JCM 7358 / NBRC 10748 / NRRL Y-17804) TaxID=698492 RepID=UPI0008679D8F|nr:uncharacterized protein SAICODRAFT_143601 [Saitoella complicata NRRL Y-17804]ODQ51755.1 hypothetical protein SAICODRAFT_143601 [Saitoella complicata NRRL Y-17804]
MRNTSNSRSCGCSLQPQRLTGAASISPAAARCRWVHCFVSGAAISGGLRATQHDTLMISHPEERNVPITMNDPEQASERVPTSSVLLFM